MNASKMIVAVSLFWSFSFAAAGEFYAFTGTCRNATGGGQGAVKLIFSDTANQLDGIMNVSGWLSGGGNLKGSRQGNTFRIKSVDASSGMEIEWQGTLLADKLSGEYFVLPAVGRGREVGEWDVRLQARQDAAANCSEKMTTEVTKLLTELMLNAPVKQADGTAISGAQSIFRAVHPAGKGLNVGVESVEIDWKLESPTRNVNDIHKFRVTYILYWQGVLTSAGWTRLRMSYNTKIAAVTSNEVVESTGTTNKQLGELAFDVGIVIGGVLMKNALESK